MPEIGLEQPLDTGRNVLGGHVGIEQCRDSGVGAKSSADMQVIPLDLITVVVDRHLGTNQPDVADIVLGAGIVAASQVDVDRLVERYARLTVLSDRRGVALGVGGRELAAAAATSSSHR